jgi:hypothetical protein
MREIIKENSTGKKGNSKERERNVEKYEQRESKIGKD